MAINLGTSPYYDDFDIEQNFHRILFKPGYAVQARELTQLQTILQNQIQRFGDFVFKDGSVVVGCSETFQFSVPFVKIKNTNAAGTLITGNAYTALQTTLVGATISNELGVSAKIVRLDEDSLGQRVLYLNYQTAFHDEDTEITQTVFGADESLNIVDFNGVEQSFDFSVSSVSPTGVGSLYTIDDGIVYVDGAFVRHESQTRVLDFYSNIPTKNVGFRIVTSTVNSDDDVSLLDPASGSYNFAAPGADRFKLTTQIESYSLEVIPDTGFYLLFNVTEGKVKRAFNKPQFSELQRVLAQRTFDESGNYVVNGLNVNIREHLNIDDNNGRFTDDGDSSLLLYGIEPGKAYVEGFDTELKATDYLAVEKATETILIDEQQIPTIIGNFVYVKNVSGTWGVGTTISTTSLYATPAGTVTATTASTTVTGVGTTFTTEVGVGDVLKNLAGVTIGTVESITSNTVLVLTANAAVAVTAAAIVILVATAKVRLIKYFVDISGTVYYKLYLYDVVLETGKSLADLQTVTSIVSGTNTAEVAITPGDNLGTNIVQTEFKLHSTAYNSLIFPTASKAVVEYENDTDFFFWKNLGTFTFNGSGNAAVSVSGTGQTLVTTAGDVDKNFLVVKSNGDYVTITGITNTTTTSCTLSVDSGDAGTHTVLARIRQGNGDPIDLTLNTSFLTVEGADFTSDENFTDNIIYLGVPHVHDVEFVYVADDAEEYPATEANLISNGNWTNITQDFILRPNTTDNEYRTSYIEYLGALTLTDKLLVIKFRNFTRASSLGYINRNSYQSSLIDFDPTSPDLNKKIYTYELPLYTTQTTGATYDVRDVIDFRPTVVLRTGFSGKTYATSIGSPLDENDNVPETTLNTVNGITTPDPDSTLSATFTINLPRKDKLILTRDGEFKVVRGISSVNPQTPGDANQAMTLAVIELAPYPSLSTFAARTFGREDYASIVRLVDNRRYTMRDIGEIEQRVNRLEYYTVLSIAENRAANMLIQDSAGAVMAKKGILVDAFDGHGIGNVYDSEYRIAIDTKNKTLRAPFTIENVEFYLPDNIGDTITTVNTGATTALIENRFVSKSRVCGNSLLGNYMAGQLQLDPPQATWFDTEARPDVQVNYNGVNDGWEFSETPFDIHWNGWQNIWFGLEITNLPVVSINTVGGLSGTRKNEFAPLIADIMRGLITSGKLPENNLRSVGVRVIDASVVPYIAQRPVMFVATGMKPGTAVRAYFDGEEVTAHCRSFTISADDARELSNSLLLSDETGNNYGDALIVDEDGSLVGQFLIPKKRFRAGSKVFKLIDTNETTSAATQFHAVGVAEINEGTIASTRFPEIRQDALSETQNNIVSRLLLNNPATFNPSSFGDPMAQTFIIEGEPDGVFVNGVDVFFRTKSSNKNFTVQIREVVNGYPGNKIVPFSTKTLNAANITISETATTATTFTFDNPVYLKNNTEYALVLLPENNSTDFQVWVSELGETLLGTNERIAQQPYVGVLFIPNNNTSWTALEKEDLKFAIKTQAFQSSRTVIFESMPIDYVKLSATGNYTLRAGDTFQVEDVDENVTCTGVVQETYDEEVKLYITEGELVVGDEFTVSGTTFEVDEIVDKVVTALAPNFGILELAPTTQVALSYKILQQPNVYFPSIVDDFIPFKNGDTIELPETFTLFSHSNTTDNIATLKVKAVLTTSRPRLTPVIDTRKMSTLAIGNDIENEDSNAVYITRAVTLDGDGADDLQVFFDMMKPETTSVTVEVKLQSLEDDRPFADVEYIEMIENAPTVYNSGVFQEYKYTVPVEDLTQYVKFAVKITMFSPDKSKTPMIKNFRAVAVI
jgi:hypothetical protein